MVNFDYPLAVWNIVYIIHYSDKITEEEPETIQLFEYGGMIIDDNHIHNEICSSHYGVIPMDFKVTIIKKSREEY